MIESQAGCPTLEGQVLVLGILVGRGKIASKIPKNGTLNHISNCHWAQETVNGLILYLLLLQNSPEQIMQNRGYLVGGILFPEVCEPPV